MDQHTLEWDTEKFIEARIDKVILFMRYQLFLLGASYPHLYSLHIINALTVKIIAFCNLQFICHFTT